MNHAEIRPERTYPSKRDGWIVAALWAGVGGLLAAAVGILSTPMVAVGQLMLVALCTVMAGVCVWVLNSTVYTLTSVSLVIRSGPMRITVPLNAIVEVCPTRNPLSAPALSLDRLRVKYKGAKRVVLISPADKARFLENLVEYCPRLEIDGEGVHSRSAP